MLVRAAGTGDWSQTASISASTDTARLRFISSVASTARCLGAPNGTTVSPALSCNGPRTPNWKPAFDIARQPSGSTWVSDHHCDLHRLPRDATARLWPLHAQQYVSGPLVLRRTRVEHLEKTLTRLTVGHQFGIVCPVRFAAEHPLALTSHCPVTTQRPDSARQPTKIRRSTMNMLSPDQMPASPQSNTSDSQISGRKPANALTTVAVRMNAASPAPSRTPSIAKTTPAKGNWPTRNHHGVAIAASTDRSSVKSSGSTEAPAANTPAKAVAAIADDAVTRRAVAIASAPSPPPSAAPTNACAAIASESRTSARKLHTCNTTWWAASAAAPKRAATAAADTKHA